MSTKPPLSYYGGKQRIASKIIPLIPKHTVYVEPFAGGLAVFFKKPWPGATNKDHYREVVNDLDNRITDFYRDLRDNPQELIRQLSLTPYSRQEYEASRGCKDSRELFIQCIQSFGNKIDSGWGTSVYSGNHAAVWCNKLKLLRPAAERLQGVYIECQDALKVIDRWDSPQTFFYCDPPYPGTSQGHYTGYSQDDYAALVDKLGTIQGSCILSNYGPLQGEPLHEGWERFALKTKSSVSNTGNSTGKAKDRVEVLHRKIQLDPGKDALRKVYNSGKLDCFTGHPGQTMLS